MVRKPPSHDPTRPQPGRIFWKGAWRTKEQIERYRAKGREYQAWYAQTEKGRLREKNRIRLNVLGSWIELPNEEARRFARHLRDEYKEAQRGRS